MVDGLTRHQQVRHLATAALVVDVFVFSGACGYGVFQLIVADDAARGLAFVGAGLAGLLFGVLLYCLVLLVHKFVNYAFRAYDALLEATELLRRQEEHGRTIAENSSLSEWAKRIVYREKDYEFLRDTIQAAIVRQDWEAAQHLINDVDTQFGYHDEAAHWREKLEQARQATTQERVAAALARFELLCDQMKWGQARDECERLRALFPAEERILALPRELEQRRQDVKRKLLRQYDHALRTQDVDHAHRLLYALDEYIVPQEAEALKESARGVFRARLEQLQSRFSIAVSYKQFPSAIEAGEHLIREFPNSGYAQEISKLLPILRERARQPGKAHAVSAPPPAAT